jgi:hypothetical protein
MISVQIAISKLAGWSHRLPVRTQGLRLIIKYKAPDILSYRSLVVLDGFIRGAPSTAYSIAGITLMNSTPSPSKIAESRKVLRLRRWSERRVCGDGQEDCRAFRRSLVMKQLKNCSIKRHRQWVSGTKSHIVHGNPELVCRPITRKALCAFVSGMRTPRMCWRAYAVGWPRYKPSVTVSTSGRLSTA